MILRHCEICGEEFHAKPAEVAKGWGRFCSRRCQGKWQSQARTGENSGHWGGGPVDCICEICGKEFAVRPGYIKQGSGRFCSNTCRGQWLTLTGAVRGENNPHWKGGYMPDPYPITFNRVFKKKIRQRDNHQCAICRQPGKCVHHVNYVKRDTHPENCITLCRKCHNVTNYNRPYWQAALTNLLQARTIGAAAYA